MATTEVVFWGELSAISLRIENICIETVRRQPDRGGKAERRQTYILMACVCKDNDGKTAQGRDQTPPADNANLAAVRHGVSLEKVREHKDDKISNGDESNHAGVFEGIKTP